MADLLNLGFNLPFDEAIDITQEREPVLPEEYYGAKQAAYRQAAFSVAGVASVDQAQSVLDSLTKTLQDGKSFADWKKEVAVQDFGLPEHRLDNIFRTNLQSAYNAGHWQSFTESKDSRPYLMYDAINDSRTRPTHLAMDGVIRRVDDPFWKTHYPPNGYRCRCRCISLTEAQARTRKGFNAPITPAMKPDAGWDYNVGENISAGAEKAIAKRKESGVDARLLNALDNKLSSYQP